jgi:hypothetical protein
MTYSVTGEILVNGKPVRDAAIAFHPTKKSEGRVSTSRGITDSEGKFTLTTFVAGDGAPEGEYIVTVYWPERPLNPSGEVDQLPADRLGGRFANTARSNLRAQIGQRPTTLLPVDLSDPKVVKVGEYLLSDEEG